MPATLLAPVAAILYLAATGLQLLHISQRRQPMGNTVLWLTLAALACHAVIAWQAVSASDGLELGFYRVSALIFLVTNIACVVSLLRRPLQYLLVVLFPLAALSVLVSTFAPETATQHPRLSGGVMLHVVSSILAYAVLTLAAVQAALVAAQDYQLRHRHTRGIVQILPTLAIVSGIVFIDDIFGQHLVHKTVLTILAWLMFTLLLWGHNRLGWRSQTAVRLTLAGFVLLVLAFFGSKLVLELVLQR